MIMKCCHGAQITCISRPTYQLGKKTRIATLCMHVTSSVCFLLCFIVGYPELLSFIHWKSVN